MPDWLMKALGAAYPHVPKWIRPTAKKTFVWGSLRAEAVTQRRALCRGQRVEFLDFETAHLEPFEFVGPGRGEVQIRALASCVSPGTERAVLCGLPGARRAFPYPPGYSMVGVVERVGRGTRGFKVGDLVAGRMPHASHGNLTPVSLFKVPDGVDPAQASFLELGIITLQGIRKARITPGRSSRRRRAGPDRSDGGPAGAGRRRGPHRRGRRVAASQRLGTGAGRRRRVHRAVGRSGRDEPRQGRHRDRGRRQRAGHHAGDGGGQARRHGRAARQLARSRTRSRLVGASRSSASLRWSARISACCRRATPARAAGPTSRRDACSSICWRRDAATSPSLITWRPRPEECNEVYEVLAEGGREHVGIVFEWARLGDSDGGPLTARAAGADR